MNTLNYLVTGKSSTCQLCWKKILGLEKKIMIDVGGYRQYPKSFHLKCFIEENKEALKEMINDYKELKKDAVENM